MGRSGTALGPSSYVEINPLRWLGFCAFASESQASSSMWGGTAHGWDFSTGMCVTAHAPEKKGFLLSPFIQMTFQNEHDRIVVPEGNGVFYRDGDNKMRREWVLGSTIDRAIVRNGPHWALRIGRNFGKGPAAKEAGGVYAIGGVIFPLDHPVMLARSLRSMVGWKSPAPPTSAGVSQQAGDAHRD